MNYFIVKDIEGKQGFLAYKKSENKAQEVANSKKFDAVVVPSNKDPQLVFFEKQPDGTWLDIERNSTPEEIKAKQDWSGLEDDLELVELVDSTGETFFTRALIQAQNQNAYALLLNCFGANKWGKRLPIALQVVKDSLTTQLTANEVEQLNTILSNRGFNITIT